jgi:RNA polymerase sigma factor (sigma-70 family)
MRNDPAVIILVTRAQDGDQEAWDEIIERFAPLVWSICHRFRLADADAHDVGQNVWLRLVEHLDVLREPAALPGWLATTTRRECIRVQRLGWKRDRQLADPELDVPADEDQTQVDQWLIAAERQAALRTAFADLGDRCRELLGMLMADPPVAYAQISLRLGMPVGAIGPNRSRCLSRLRQHPSIAALVEDAPAGLRGGARHDKPMVG